MPSYTPEDIDITPEEFVSSCSKREIKELIEVLVVEEYIFPSQVDTFILTTDFCFEESINKLHGNKHQLTARDEEIILSICNKLI